MEDSLTKEIESSTDENMVITRNAVDNSIVLFKLSCTQDERNDMVMKVFALVEKKYIGPQNTRFEENKNSIIGTIVKSYVGSVKMGKPNIH
jgi:hypothetical protein